ncbi:MAG TPA: hypothetical protein VLV76_02010 [Candidatus Acidoferrum sp.]|nr:hypothetical protein [Candidatus Acidoferrum sp.]
MVVTLPGVAAAAPMYCGQRNDVLAKLADSHHEQPASIALTNDGQLLEVLKSDSGVAWAILITTPQGLSCVVADGSDWQSKQIDRVVQDPQL